jgi:hypothetical protein
MTHGRSLLKQNTGTWRWILTIILFIIVFSAQYSAAAEPLNVYVVNYPLKYFAERIGGDHVKVEFPVPADVDPAYWNPDLTNISAFQKADLIVLNGAGYAKWVAKVSLPRSKIVNTSRKFKDRYIFTKEVVTHSHGAGGDHAHEALAFTTWLDLTLAARQAEAIASAMGRKRPELRDTFQSNFEALARDLKGLDQDISSDHIPKTIDAIDRIPSGVRLFYKALWVEYRECALGAGPGSRRRAVECAQSDFEAASGKMGDLGRRTRSGVRGQTQNPRHRQPRF